MEQDTFSCNQVHRLEDILNQEHSSKEEPLLRLSGFGLGVSSAISLTTTCARVGSWRGIQSSPPSPYCPRTSLTFQDSHKQSMQWPNYNQRQTTGTTIFTHFRATAPGITSLKHSSQAAAPRLLTASPHRQGQSCFLPQLRLPLTPPRAQVLLLPHSPGPPPIPCLARCCCPLRWDCSQEKGTEILQPGPVKKHVPHLCASSARVWPPTKAAHIPTRNYHTKHCLAGPTFPLSADFTSFYWK